MWRTGGVCMGDAAGFAALPGGGDSGGPGALHCDGAAVEPACQRQPRVLRNPGCCQLHPADRPLRAPRPILPRGVHTSHFPSCPGLLTANLRGNPCLIGEPWKLLSSPVLHSNDV